MVKDEAIFFTTGAASQAAGILNIFANPSSAYSPILSTNHFYGYLGVLIAFVLGTMGSLSAASGSLNSIQVSFYDFL